jgi:hypothetical protein
LVYYRPEQVRKNTLNNEDLDKGQDLSVKHFKSELKLGVANAMRKRTKTDLKQYNQI